MTEILLVSGVTKLFGAGDTEVRAVDDVNLSVVAGQLVLIMGPSGSGKTTLLTIIGGLLRPTSGSVVIDGIEITSLNERELAPVRREKVGFIFQSFNLWETLSVEENVELVLNMAGITGRAARERARTLLEDRGLRHRLSFRSRDLSGGEKQRVSIARALANEPRLLLADEPTANLDSKHGRDVMRLLKDLASSSDRAVIAVSRGVSRHGASLQAWRWPLRGDRREARDRSRSTTRPGPPSARRSFWGSCREGTASAPS